MATNQLDEIRLRDIRIPDVSLGIYPHERQNPQPVLLAVSMWADLGAAARTEDIRATIDYAAVCEALVRHAKSRHFPLVETLCGQLAEMLLTDFPLAERVEVEVTKPWAVALGTVSIIMERTR